MKENTEKKERKLERRKKMMRIKKERKMEENKWKKEK